jgi:hypothetical protein
MGVHAPGESEEFAQRLLILGLAHSRHREQVLAGCLGRIEPGTADPELLRLAGRKLDVGLVGGWVRPGRHAMRAHAAGEGDQLGVR